MKSKYPSDWPCKCGHAKKDHSTFDSLGYGSFSSPACQILNTNIKGKYADACVAFTPVDNLTYVEGLANARAANL